MYGQAGDRSSARWSFDAAVIRANNRRGHEDVPIAQFDDQFLRGRAAPILMRYMESPASPSPDELAFAWLEHQGKKVEFRGEAEKRAIAMAASYLLRLDEELWATDPSS